MFQKALEGSIGMNYMMSGGVRFAIMPQKKERQS